MKKLKVRPEEENEEETELPPVESPTEPAADPPWEDPSEEPTLPDKDLPWENPYIPEYPEEPFE